MGYTALDLAMFKDRLLGWTRQTTSLVDALHGAVADDLDKVGHLLLGTARAARSAANDVGRVIAAAVEAGEEERRPGYVSAVLPDVLAGLAAVARAHGELLTAVLPDGTGLAGRLEAIESRVDEQGNAIRSMARALLQMKFWGHPLHAEIQQATEIREPLRAESQDPAAAAAPAAPPVPDAELAAPDAYTSTSRRAELRHRCDTATRGPWTASFSGQHVDAVGGVVASLSCAAFADHCHAAENVHERVQNAKFIAAARDGLPACLDELDRQDKELADLHAVIVAAARAGKHGPRGSGERGPCDAHCIKCAAERLGLLPKKETP